MELDEFVTSTIELIIKGVSDAQRNGKDNVINPRIYNNSENRNLIRGAKSIHQIKFDVAVTTEDKTGVEGKAKISVLGATIGGGSDTEALSKIATRIQFEIPITYPNEIKEEND